MFKTDIYPAEGDLLVAGWIMARGLIDGALNADVFLHILGLGIPLAVFLLWVMTGSLRQAVLAAVVVVGANIIWTWGEIGLVDTVLFPLKERMDMLSELRCVDEVIPVRSSIDALRRIKPDIFVKGQEYESGLLTEDIAYCTANGIQVAFTFEKTYSSTSLLSHESRRR